MPQIRRKVMRVMSEANFRLVLYCNAPESRSFWGGRLAASPLAYYYHINRIGGVILGTSFILQGLGRFVKPIRDVLEVNERLTTFPLIIEDNKATISPIGYLYQNRDPIYDSLGGGM